MQRSMEHDFKKQCSREVSLNKRFNFFFPCSSMKLFSIHFWLFLKTFPHDDIGRAHLQITFSLVRGNEIEVSAVCKRNAFPSLPSSVITLFNLHFILKHMYRNKQVINSSSSSILCLACKPLTSLPVPQEGLVIGWGGQIHYSVWAASTLMFHESMWQAWRRSVIQGNVVEATTTFMFSWRLNMNCAHMFQG